MKISKVIIMEQIYDNPEWDKFLKTLPNEYQREIASIVMTWIKDTYPEFKDKLNGKLIADITREAKLGE